VASNSAAVAEPHIAEPEVAQTAPAAIEIAADEQTGDAVAGTTPLQVEPVAPASPPPPEAAAAQSDDASVVAVSSQVEADLETLGVLRDAPLPAAVHEAAATPPVRPLESELLSHAWESTITAEPTDTARADVPADQADEAQPEIPEPSGERLPSMWLRPAPAPSPAPADSPAEEAPADFLLEPLPDTDAAVPVQPAAPLPAPVDGGRATFDIEAELFDDEPEPVSAMVQPPMQMQAATAAASTPPEKPADPAPAVAAAPAPPPPAPATRAAPRPMPRHTASDPLAALKAMSDEERIALFT
jgi:hypothetical protein